MKAGDGFAPQPEGLGLSCSSHESWVTGMSPQPWEWSCAVFSLCQGLSQPVPCAVLQGAGQEQGLEPRRWHQVPRNGTGPDGCFGSKGREMCCCLLDTHPSCPKYPKNELVLSAQGGGGAVLQHPARSLDNFRFILCFPDTFQQRFPKHISNNRQFFLLLPLSGY